jgi:hypothetical protein
MQSGNVRIRRAHASLILGGWMPEERTPRELYRYRTKALTGPWQPTIGAAIDDAIRAGQMRVDVSGQIHWLAPGEIERSLVAKGAPPSDLIG